MIYVDTNESDELLAAIQSYEPATRYPLNIRGLADIWWAGLDGLHQVENKAVGEIFDNLDAVEAQLQKQYNYADFNTLLIRDIAVPDKSGKAVQWRVEGKPKRVRKSKTFYYAYSAWLEALRVSAIDVIEVANLDCVVQRIVSMYRNSMRTDHEILRRPHRPKITIPEHNPHVIALMGLSIAYGLGIGANKARKLIAQFGSLYAVLHASSDELCVVEGVGSVIADKLCCLPSDPTAKRPKLVGNDLPVILS